MKKIIVFILIALLLLSSVMAFQSVSYIPEGMTVEEYKDATLEANNINKFFALLPFATGFTTQYAACYTTFPYNCYWSNVDLNNPPFNGGCDDGYKPSGCFWSPDSISSTACNGKTANECCQYTVGRYNMYGINLQCNCVVSQVYCSGGASPGDYKCENSKVSKCSSSGSWTIVESCSNGCDGDSCRDAPACNTHSSSKCDSGDVYWYDSCGNKEDMKSDCNDQESCSNGNCVATCNEGFTGASYCDNNNNVVQSYQKSDCTTEVRTLTNCLANQICNNGVCNDKTCPTCNSPGAWSSCVNKVMTRDNYKCDSSTNFVCQYFQDSKSCGCTSDNECANDEYCETGSTTCQKVVCVEPKYLGEHECIGGSFDFSIIIIVIVSLIFIGSLVFVYFKIKSGAFKIKR